MGREEGAELHAFSSGVCIPSRKKGSSLLQMSRDVGISSFSLTGGDAKWWSAQMERSKSISVQSTA